MPTAGTTPSGTCARRVTPRAAARSRPMAVARGADDQRPRSAHRAPSSGDRSDEDGAAACRRAGRGDVGQRVDGVRALPASVATPAVAVDRLSGSGWRVLLTESLGRGEYARRSRATTCARASVGGRATWAFEELLDFDRARPRVSFTILHVSLAVLLAFALLGYLIDLGGSSIWDANEAYYVETPREMIESGDYRQPVVQLRAALQQAGALVLDRGRPLSRLRRVGGDAARGDRGGGADHDRRRIPAGARRLRARRGAALLAAAGLAAGPRFFMFAGGSSSTWRSACS